MAIGKNQRVFREFHLLFHIGKSGDLTDGQLLELFFSGQGEAAEMAFATLVERHGPMVLRVCRAILADAHETQDAFQATFLVLVKKGRSLWVQDSLGPWLHQVAYRTASCARVAAARRRRHEQGASLLRQEARVDHHDDLSGILHQEIERLPERFRVPLILCDMEGRSHEQAARHLGWPVGTVKSRRARARQRLRERLLRRGVTPSAEVVVAVIRSGGSPSLVSPMLAQSTAKVASQFAAVRILVQGSAASLARGVLKSMYFTQCLKIGSILLVLGASASGVGLMALQEKGSAIAAPGGKPLAARTGEVPTVTVKGGKLRVTVIERGSLEAPTTADIYSRIEGQTTVMQIVPEGSVVKKGQIICELDSASLKDQLINQIITENAAEASFRNAKLSRETAEIAVAEYADGISKSEMTALTDAITASESAINKAETRQARIRLARQKLNTILAAKGAERAATDIVADLDLDDRADATALTLLREQHALRQAREKLTRYEKFTRPKILAELDRDLNKAVMNQLAKQATWELEKSRVQKLEKQIAACTIKAPTDGALLYAELPNRTGGFTLIEKGVTVRERQKLFSVVDRTGPMIVNTKVHESQIDKLAEKMKAKVKVDAYTDVAFDGTVEEIAGRPDPATERSKTKLYTTKIKIDPRAVPLVPGMTARVEILVAEHDNVLSVPVEAIVQHDGKDHIIVMKADGLFDAEPSSAARATDSLWRSSRASTRVSVS